MMLSGKEGIWSVARKGNERKGGESGCGPLVTRGVWIMHNLN